MKTKRFKATLEVEVVAPDDATTEDMGRFLAYEFQATHEISSLNPCFFEGEYEVLTYDIEEK